MIGNYRSGEYIAAAEASASGDEVVVVMLRRDPGDPGGYRSVLWKASERSLPASGKIPATGRMRLHPAAANALREALTDATAPPQLSLTLHGLQGQRVTVSATDEPLDRVEELRSRYGTGELAALSALCAHMTMVVDQALAPPEGEPPPPDPDPAIEGIVLPDSFTPNSRAVPPPPTWVPPMPPPIPPQ